MYLSYESDRESALWEMLLRVDFFSLPVAAVTALYPSSSLAFAEENFAFLNNKSVWEYQYPVLSYLFALIYVGGLLHLFSEEFC